MTFKIFLLCIVLACCISIGLKISHHYAIREGFYKDLCDFCRDYKLKVSYSRQKILNIIDTSKDYGKEFSKFLVDYKKYVTCEIDETLFAKSKSIYFLKSDEKECVVERFLSLGSMSKDEEVEKCMANEMIFNDKFQDCKLDRNKFSSLYVKLFIVLALFVFIIFI